MPKKNYNRIKGFTSLHSFYSFLNKHKLINSKEIANWHAIFLYRKHKLTNYSQFLSTILKLHAIIIKRHENLLVSFHEQQTRRAAAEGEIQYEIPNFIIFQKYKEKINGDMKTELENLCTSTTIHDLQQQVGNMSEPQL